MRPCKLAPVALMLAFCLSLSACGNSQDATAGYQPRRPECIAPASPGGGFDLTCKLAQRGLVAQGLLASPMRVTYMPGGIGAVAYNAVAAQRPRDEGTIVAWSSGSLLNLAQGKFGRFDEHAVRWLAGVATSYGALVVREDSPYRNLEDLVAALKSNPGQVVIGAGGTVGSQDWMQAALVAEAAGVDPRMLRYVAMEGGGDLSAALLGGHIQVASSDIADAVPHLQAGKVRVLAVFSEERLPGDLMEQIPTALEQGYDIRWPVVRGFYMGPEVSDEAYAWWLDAFGKLLASEDFARLRREQNLFPLAMTGQDVERHVDEQVAQYRRLAKRFGLVQ